jgi:hypothetical protein
MHALRGGKVVAYDGLVNVPAGDEMREYDGTHIYDMP